MMLWRVLKSWLAGDRIRISPHAGELLRLQVGQRVIMNDELWVIDQRCLRGGDQIACVSYHLVRHGMGKHPIPSQDPPFLGDHEVWVVNTCDEDSVWLDCYL